MIKMVILGLLFIVCVVGCFNALDDDDLWPALALSILAAVLGRLFYLAVGAQ